MTADSSSKKDGKKKLTEDVESKINEIISEGAGAGAVKMEVDYSDTVAKKIPEALATAANGNLDGALDSLTAIEKLTRTGADMHSNAKVLVAIVQICFEVR
jgi:26S proteasome regulatory subunit N5